MNRAQGCVLAGCAMLASFVSHAQPPPASAFARLPDIQSVRISPDGGTLAWIGDDKGLRVIQIYDLESRQFLTPATTGDRWNLKSLEWGNDDILVVEMGVHRQVGNAGRSQWSIAYNRYFAIDKANRKTARMLLSELPQYINARTRLLAIHTGPVPVAILPGWEAAHSQGCRRGGIFRNVSDICERYNLFQVDLVTGKSTKIGDADVKTFRWYVNAAGSPIAQVHWSGFQHRAQIDVPANGDWKTVQEIESFYQLETVGVEAGGKALLAIGARGGATTAIWRLPLDGQPVSGVYAGDDDAEEVVVDVYTGEVLGIRLGGEKQLVHWLDAQMARVQSTVEATFPDKRVTIISRSSNARRIVVQVDSLALAPTYYAIDLDRGTADLIGEAYPELSAHPPGPVSLIRFRARDGIEIPAYLTLPSGREASRLPLVVLLHDDIEGRDPAGFDWRSQFLASRGYAVLQPQFRGSSGFGTALRQAGREAWGRAIQDDIRDGASHLAARGIVDLGRVCIVGEGYGGWLALSSAVLAPDYYACVAGINAVADLQNQYDFLNEHYWFDGAALLQYWNERVGPARKLEFANVSPVRHPKRLEPMVLLIHARDDAYVPYSQSLTLSKALDGTSKLQRFVTIPGDGHEFDKAASREQLLRELEDFLGAHLNAAP